MGPKKLFFGKEGRDKLLEGTNEITKAVASTMGAGGKYVMIGNLQGAPSRYTKDGVSVAENTVFKNMHKNMGALLIKTAARDVVNEVGDGTTLVSVLTNSVINDCAKAIEEGVNPRQFKAGMDKAVAEVVKFIKEKSVTVTHDSQAIKDIATISANNDKEIGALIAKGMEHVGMNGRITVDNSNSYETTIEPINGIQINKGFMSPHFVNVPGKEICELKNPYILYWDNEINTAKPVAAVIATIMEDIQKKEIDGSILIFCENMVNEAQGLIIYNKNRGALRIAVVKLPEFGVKRKALMDDVTTITGGTFITQDMGVKLEKVNLLQLGYAEKVIIDKNKTLIVGGKGSKTGLEARIESVKSLLSEAAEEDKEFLQQRLAELSGGVAVMKVGGVTETAIEEKMDRIDDAIRATKASLEEGVVPGGGSTYLHASKELMSTPLLNGRETTPTFKKILAFIGFKITRTYNISDYTKGYDTVIRAIQMPFKQILTNADVADIESLAEATKSGDFGTGYNVITSKIENLPKSGVIDPAKVVRVALEKAASIGGMFVLTECVIHDEIG